MSWSRVAQTNSNKKTKTLLTVNNLHKQKDTKEHFEHKQTTPHRNDDFIMKNKSHVNVTVYNDNNKDECCKYQSPLDIIRKRQLIFYGYIRKQNHFYPNEIIKIIYNFYFIKILNCKI
eukprot:251864_1